MHSQSATDASRSTLLMKGTWRPLKSRKSTKAAVLETWLGVSRTQAEEKHDILESCYGKVRVSAGSDKT